jgi:phage tail sheath protein FI
MSPYKTPGVYREDFYPQPEVELLTGVPAFLGFTRTGVGNTKKVNEPRMLTRWPQFEELFGKPLPNGYLGFAVRGFFENGGDLCYVVSFDGALTFEQALQKGLEAIAPFGDIDLICSPDVMRPRPQGTQPNRGLRPDPAEVNSLQTAILTHCDDLGDRLAILDPLPCIDTEAVLAQRQSLGGTNGTLYYPWIRVPDEITSPPWLKVEECPQMVSGFVPPCGHIAGVYARSDRRFGVHKPPANEAVEGVVDLEVSLNDPQQGLLNSQNVNCLRGFSGRGIRIWGARTLSREPAWTYINVRRLFLTVGRWIERNMPNMVFEPNDPRLWSRIVRELTGYFTDLFRRGALKGRTPQEAFYVKCDAETNPPEVRQANRVVTEIGLAPSVPNEFVIVGIVHGADGVTISGPTMPG